MQDGIFLMRLQWLDEKGEGLYDLCHPTKNPIFECQSGLANMLFGGIRTGPLKALFWHFDVPINDGDDDRIYDNMVSGIRRMLASLSAQVSYRKGLRLTELEIEK